MKKRKTADHEPFARKVLKLVDSFLNGDLEPKFRTNAQQAYIFTVLYFLTKARQNLAAVIQLCRLGYSIQAMMVARSTFEMVITLRYIHNDIPGRAMRFMEYDWVKRKGLYDKMNQYKTEWPDLMAGAKPDKLKEILREYNKVKDRFADAYNWAGNRKGIAALARDIKADFAYDFQYDLLCQIAHNSVTLMNEYVDEHKTGKLVIRRGKNSKYRTAALATVAGHTLVLADLFGDMYELGRDEEIEELLEELKRL